MGAEPTSGGTPAKKPPASTPSSSSGGAYESQTSFASAASSSTGNSASNVTPLDSASALHLLLSPDGYYRYLCVPKPPESRPGFLPAHPTDDDDEKKPLNGADGAGSGSEVDHDLVKKNYRRLSLRHHPDRRGGDADTFRVLNRAKRVLTNPKLRRQYDLLGLDLDDDEEDHHEEGKGSEHGGDQFQNDSGKGSGDGGGDDKKSGESGGSSSSSSSSPDSVMSHLASATLATILQVAVRTAAMGLASTFLCRYRLTVVPSVLFMAFVSYRVRGIGRVNPGSVTVREVVAPLVIAGGMGLMYWGRNVERDIVWSWTFWLGEASVMTVFTMNSIPTRNPAALGGFALASVVLSLILRGKFWRYASVVALEATLAFIAVLVFPIMEMILEEIMNEKLRKIGEQVRAHARRMDEYAARKAAAAAAEAEVVD